MACNLYSLQNYSSQLLSMCDSSNITNYLGHSSKCGLNSNLSRAVVLGYWKKAICQFSPPFFIATSGLPNVKVSRFKKTCGGCAIQDCIFYQTMEIPWMNFSALVQAQYVLFHVQIHVIKPHCYSIRLNLQKMGSLQFCLPVFLGIHKKPKQKDFFVCVSDF